MLVLLLLEKIIKKTSAASDLPSSLTPFDGTAASRKGAKCKGPKPERGKYEKVRLEVEQQTSPVCECSGCGEDFSEAASEDHQRRVLVDIEFVTKETRIDAEIKRCPICSKINRGVFPENMPGPLQYGCWRCRCCTPIKPRSHPSLLSYFQLYAVDVLPRLQLACRGANRTQRQCGANA